MTILFIISAYQMPQRFLPKSFFRSQNSHSAHSQPPASIKAVLDTNAAIVRVSSAHYLQATSLSGGDLLRSHIPKCLRI